MRNPPTRYEIGNYGRILEVTGRRPEDQPYIWIGEHEGPMFGTLDEKQMRYLRDAIDLALGKAAPKPAPPFESRQRRKARR